ncbi:1111_t:CDS:2 [Ambispora leptoticha]|uniref:1111_t:CDS:1 n=1 Tax=Ambispora leptoticha TaxID=144679 RepID=A0A9N9FXZ2_9GLOM|nr:1111_t:CDS:2 [Ambispora leptoticha]
MSAKNQLAFVGLGKHENNTPLAKTALLDVGAILVHSVAEILERDDKKAASFKLNSSFFIAGIIELLSEGLILAEKQA